MHDHAYYSTVLSNVLLEFCSIYSQQWRRNGQLHSRIKSPVAHINAQSNIPTTLDMYSDITDTHSHRSSINEPSRCKNGLGKYFLMCIACAMVLFGICPSLHPFDIAYHRLQIPLIPQSTAHSLYTWFYPLCLYTQFAVPATLSIPDLFAYK